MRLLLSLFALCAVPLLAQAPVQPDMRLSARPLHANAIVPQARNFSAAPQPVQITGVNVQIKVVDQAATTSLVIKLHNPGRAMAEAEMLLPVPMGCVIGRFDFDGAGAEPSAVLLPVVEARRIYDDIVRRYKDPAIMQFSGLSLVRTSVFPVPAGGNQEIRFSYDHVLPANGARVDYELPRSEALSYRIPWAIHATLNSTRPIAGVYSPSHELNTERKSDQVLRVSVTEKSRLDPGPFRLSYLVGGEGVAASLFAYPDPKVGGGYFLMIAGLPPRPADSKRRIPREVTIVLDRSGSMAGDKWKQARAAALQVIAGLAEDEHFNVIAYSDQVDTLFAVPMPRTEVNEKSARTFLSNLRPLGGTNIHDALIEALRQKPVADSLPMVLFLTDGLPTIGNTGEKAIRELAVNHNPHARRVFTFGVGVDVNAPLLEAISDTTRGSPTFVLPGEDVEIKVADVARRLHGPVMASPELALPRDGAGGVRVTEVLPGTMADLYEGEQLVLLGRYTGDAPLEFSLKGNYLGTPREFKFTFALDNATTRNSFVPRLWAGRKVGMLVDAIRQAGADLPLGAQPGINAYRELIDEIIRLSTEFGILTEYTAFLALEGTDLSKKEDVQVAAWNNLRARGQQQRTGSAGVSQSANNDEMKKQHKENKRNEWMDDKLNRVSVGKVQQANDRAFFERGGRWVDSRLLDRAAQIKPAREITVGTPEYTALVEKLENQGRASCVSLEGEILLLVDGEIVLIKPAKN
ncbi:MAG: VWA domain-containing protein [Planctomycetes bacterium]|jgi:Ca-activated chloride channel family protein|nr:VWA domain-containing protein [Planctomycetota bacterium]MCL4730045.1 VWA domain-containing protein [Planctomycetota bacterium]